MVKDSEAWHAAVHEVAELDTPEWQKTSYHLTQVRMAINNSLQKINVENGV